MTKRVSLAFALAALIAQAGDRAAAQSAPGDLTKNTLPAYLGPNPVKLPRPKPAAAMAKPAGAPLTAAAQLIANAQAGRIDVPRVELAARLAAGGLHESAEYTAVRENAARELAGRPDGTGGASAAELKRADAAIADELAILQGTAAPPSFAAIARRAGRPQIPGLRIVYVNPLGDPASDNKWKYIIAHQTEGPAGAARAMALAQAAKPTKRGTTLWVETDGMVYWSTAEHA